VVEHAYGPVSDGLVCLRARILGEALVILLCDQGAPLPGLEIPDPSEPDLSSAPTALPEGGFGWLLIRKLAVALRYRHRAGVNHLMMRF
jgi:serine/threonine-protein kinase RsbW